MTFGYLDSLTEQAYLLLVLEALAVAPHKPYAAGAYSRGPHGHVLRSFPAAPPVGQSVPSHSCWPWCDSPTPAHKEGVSVHTCMLFPNGRHGLVQGKQGLKGC